MKSKYTELFNNITPPETDDELLRNVLSQKQNGFPGVFGSYEKTYVTQTGYHRSRGCSYGCRRCDRRWCLHRVGFHKVVPGVLFPEST